MYTFLVIHVQDTQESYHTVVLFHVPVALGLPAGSQPGAGVAGLSFRTRQAGSPHEPFGPLGD